MDVLHNALQQRLKNFNIDINALSPDVLRLLHAISDTFVDFEKDHKEARDTLEARVIGRTKELEDAKATLVGVLEDLNIEKKRVQLEKAKDDAILASIGDGVLVFDPGAKAMFINLAAKKMLGVTDVDIIDEADEFLDSFAKLNYYSYFLSIFKILKII